MKIAFVQIKCSFGDTSANINRALELLYSKKADLFVLPELFHSGYLFQSKDEVINLAEEVPAGQTCQALLKTAREKKCHIVAGIAEKAGSRVYNSSVLFSPHGSTHIYRKIHLFNEEKLWFEPGDKPWHVIDIGHARIGMMICFDWIFPESMRTLALQGADIVCHPANLVLPYCQKAMTTRCLENGMFAITANRIGSDIREKNKIGFTGKSQITGPRGDVLVQADATHEDIQVVKIDPTEARDKNINDYNHLFNDRRPSFYMSH